MMRAASTAAAAAALASCEWANRSRSSCPAAAAGAAGGTTTRQAFREERLGDFCVTAYKANLLCNEALDRIEDMQKTCCRVPTTRRLGRLDP